MLCQGLSVSFIYINSLTLNQSEQGCPPAVEFVGVPRNIRREMGRDLERGRKHSMVAQGWLKNQYLLKRQQDLKGTPAEPKSFRPVCEPVDACRSCTLVFRSTTLKQFQSMTSLPLIIYLYEVSNL